MAGAKDISEILGEAALRIPAGRAVAMGAKAGSMAARDTYGPSDEQGWTEITAGLGLDVSTPAYRAVLFTNAQYAKSPGLFMDIGGVPTPFMQTGTFLRHKGLPISEELALAMDWVLDPVNLASAGTAGLLRGVPVVGKVLRGSTMPGKVAELWTALSRSGKYTDAATVIDRGLSAIEDAARLVGKGDDLIKAAKEGNKKALKEILKASKKADVPEDIAKELAAIRANRNEFAHILKNMDDFVKRNAGGVGDELVLPGGGTVFSQLQPSLFGRLRAKQVTPLGIGITIPDNPIKHPLRFARQMVGFTMYGDRILVPAAGTIATGLDKVGVHSLVKGTAEFAEREAGVIEIQRKAFESLPFRPGKDIDARQAVEAGRMLLILDAAPNDRILKELGYDQVDEKFLRERFSQFDKKPGRKTVNWSDPETMRRYERYKERVLEKMNGVQLSRDQFLLRQRNKVLKDALDETPGLKDTVAQALKNGEIDDTLAASFDAQLRRLHDTFGIRALVADKMSPGHGLAARKNLGTLLAQTTTHNFRSIVRRTVKGRQAGAAVAEVMGLAVDNPEAFVKRGDQLFLRATTEEMEEQFPRLAAAIRRSKNSKRTAFLEEHLRAEGLNHEVTHLTEFMQDFMRQVGDNLMETGIIYGTIKDYFPRVFKPNENFFKFVKKMGAFGEGYNRLNFPKMFDDMLGDEKVADTIFKALGMGSQADTIKAIKANKISMQEARRWTDAIAVAMEEGVMIDGKKVRMGEYVHDGIQLFSSYADAANTALLMNRLVRDLPHIGGYMTRSHIVAELGEKAVEGLTDEAITKLNLRRVMHDEAFQKLPHQVKAMFGEVVSRPFSTPLKEDPDFILREGVRGALESEAANAARMDKRILDLAAELEAKELKKVNDLTKQAERALKDIERAGSSQKVRDLTKQLKDAERRFTKSTKAISDFKDEKLGALAGKARKQAAKAVSDLNAAKDALQRSMTLRSTAEAAARVRIGSKLAGKSEFTLGGAKIRLRDTGGKAVRFQEEWAHTMEIPSNVISREALVKKLERAVAQDEIVKKMSAAVDKEADVIRARAAALGKQAESKRAAVEAALGRSAARLAAEEKVIEAKLAKKATGLLADEERVLKAAQRRAAAIRKAREPLERLFDDLAKQIDAAQGVADESLEAARLQVTGQTRAVISRLRGEIRDFTTKRGPQKVHVFLPDRAQLQDAFHLSQRRYSNDAWGGFLRKWDDWNYKVKSVVLLGDIFHFNVLAFSTLARDPLRVAAMVGQDFADAIRNPAEAFRLGDTIPLPTNAAGASAIGGAIGGGITALNEQDATGITAGTVVGALYGAAIAALLKNAKIAQNMVANPQHLDSLFWMGMGGWSGRPDDRAIGYINRRLATMRNRLASEVGRQGLIHPIENVLHVVDAWDQVLWETLHNGSKHFYFQNVWAKELPRLEASLRAAKKAPEEIMQAKIDLARQIVQASNNAFGGQTWRNLLENPEFGRTARRFLLSPDWTTSRLAMAAGWFMNIDGPGKQAVLGAGLGAAFDFVQAGGDPEHMDTLTAAILGAGGGVALGRWGQNIRKRMMTKGDVLARESRKLASAALLGGYATANVLNKAFTGKWMWENDPEHRLDIDTGTHFVRLGKPWLEAFEFASVAHRDKFPIPVISRTVSKLHPIPLNAIRLVMNQNSFGGPLFVPEDNPFEMAFKAMDVAVDMGRPILFQGPIRFGAEALAGEATGPGAARALTRFAGFGVAGPMSRGLTPDLSSTIQFLQAQRAGSGLGGFNETNPILSRRL